MRERELSSDSIERRRRMKGMRGIGDEGGSNGAVCPTTSTPHAIASWLLEAQM